MKLSVFLPPWGPTATLGQVAAVADTAEELGFHGLWVGDHVVFPRFVASTYPYGDSDPFPFQPDGQLLDPITLLAFLASRTRHITVGTSVLVLPLRNPVLTAKMLATVDVLSAGRLVVGVGAGWLSEEFEALGADFARRGKVTDEWLDIMYRLWCGSPEGFSGRHYRFAPLGFVPNRPHLPIVVGGNSRAARRRAARTDGWHPLRLDRGELAAGIADVRTMAANHGRTRRSFRIVYRDSVTDLATQQAGPDRLTGAQAEAIEARLADLGDIGVDELVVEFTTLDTDGRLAWMKWLAERRLGRAMESVSGAWAGDDEAEAPCA